MPNLEKATLWLRLALASGVVSGASAPARGFDVHEATAQTTRILQSRGVMPTIETDTGLRDVAQFVTPPPLDLSWQTTVISAPLAIAGNVGLGGVHVGPDEAPNPHLFIGLSHEQGQSLNLGGLSLDGKLTLRAGTTINVSELTRLHAIEERVSAAHVDVTYRVEWQPEVLRRDGLKNSLEVYGHAEGFDTDTPSAVVGIRGVMPFASR